MTKANREAEDRQRLDNLYGYHSYYEVPPGEESYFVDKTVAPHISWARQLPRGVKRKFQRWVVKPIHHAGYTPTISMLLLGFGGMCTAFSFAFSFSPDYLAYAMRAGGIGSIVLSVVIILAAVKNDFYVEERFPFPPHQIYFHNDDDWDDPF